MTNRLLTLLLAALLALAFMPGCGGEEAGEEGDTAEANDGPVGILPLDSFLTNINDPAGEKHARVQVKLAIVPEGAVAVIQGNAVIMARLHDRVLTLLTSKTYKQLNDPAGKEEFRNEIRDELNPLLTKGQVKEVLFSDFVVE